MFKVLGSESIDPEAPRLRLTLNTGADHIKRQPELQGAEIAPHKRDKKQTTSTKTKAMVPPATVF